MVILDTSIVIDHLRTPPIAKSLLRRLEEKLPQNTLAVSMISIQELYEGKGTRDPAKEINVLSVISPLRILPYTYEIAHLAGTLARDHKRPLELGDAAIAATTIIARGQLATLNRKDFLGIPELELLPLPVLD